MATAAITDTLIAHSDSRARNTHAQTQVQAAAPVAR
jgi:hypothetical protein